MALLARRTRASERLPFTDKENNALGTQSVKSGIKNHCGKERLKEVRKVRKARRDEHRLVALDGPHHLEGHVLGLEHGQQCVECRAQPGHGRVQPHALEHARVDVALVRGEGLGNRAYEENQPGHTQVVLSSGARWRSSLRRASSKPMAPNLLAA